MNRRVLLALIVAPLLPAICASAAIAFAVERSWRSFPETLYYVFVVTEAASILIAGPAYLVLRKFFRPNLSACLLFGGLIGCVEGAAGLAVGVFSAALFWTIALRPSRPVPDECVPPSYE